MALRLCRPMLAYFDFEEIFMDETIRTKSSSSSSNKRQYIFAAQPHGVLSFVGMCSAALHPEDTIRVPTAAASIVLKTPLLKHVMGIFNLIDASATSLKRHFQNGGSVVIYIGGIAELFKTSRTEERLYLQKRKGFIKLALTEGVDIVPVYLFGNSSVLSVLTQGPLVSLSRKLQASLTLFWGKFYLPIPRDEKLLYVVGKPMGLPHILNPTQDDIDKWHEKYCIEVRKIYEAYQEKLPMYKHKKLFID
jgi:1-acyl-sn-glycerol-3-phosphate acyltransferase